MTIEGRQREKARKHLNKALAEVESACAILSTITYTLKVPILLGAEAGRIGEVLKILKEDDKR